VRTESHLGFHFATMADDAPTLHDYLGEVGRAGLGMICAFGEVEVVPGVHKNVIGCNWKIAVDNLFDWYHVAYSHASAQSAGFIDVPAILYPKDQLVMLGEYGHAIGGPGRPRAEQAKVDAMSDAERETAQRDLPPTAHRLRPRAATELMGPEGVRSYGHPNLFPNLWITLNGMQMCLRLPRGPSATELWWFTILPKNAHPDLKRLMISQSNHIFGPAGLLEQDDGDNWGQSTRAARGVASRRLGQHIVMGLGHGETADAGGGARAIDGQISEHGQRWFYRGWTEWLAARDWAELKASHSAPPTGVI
jgi:phenylpropionate dioxygenase-like ring-hydroxylating dioxygenase large terminal subunit